MGTAGAPRAASRRRCGHLLSRLDGNLARLDERPASRGHGAADRGEHQLRPAAVSFQALIAKSA
jgi:hypothetical protein